MNLLKVNRKQLIDYIRPLDVVIEVGKGELIYKIRGGAVVGKCVSGQYYMVEGLQ